MRQFFFVIVVCVVGLGVLMSFGFWQLQRLEWKEGLIAEADQMLALDPIDLPAQPDPNTDRYRAVKVSGQFKGQEAYVLTSTRDWGPGYRVIAAFETDDGRRILVDRGYIKQQDRDLVRPPSHAAFAGNLNWPDDMTAGTPEPDLEANLWFGRDVEPMAKFLDTESVMVIAKDPTGDNIVAQPATAAFKNDHLGYAITWFGLAFVWAGMTLGWLWRITRARKA